MSIYNDDVFQMACDQFQVIADYLSIDKNDRERLMYPKRAIAVTLPVHMDDGSTRTFQGYRVQHHLTLGPTKGGTRFAPNLSMGCLLYTSDAADERSSVDLGGRRI